LKHTGGSYLRREAMPSATGFNAYVSYTNPILTSRTYGESNK
jgi:hypothetical protein